MKAVAALCLSLPAIASAQSPGDSEIPPVHYPEIHARSKSLIGFIPQGWLLEAKAIGDLNRDKLADAALVLHMNDPRNRVSTDWGEPYDTNPRMLVIIFARPGGGYTLAAEDHGLIPRLENQNQEDPFDEIAIVNGALRIKMHLFMSAGGWRMGGTAYTFRWQNEGFKLIGFDRDSVMRNSGETEEVSINYLIRRKLLKKGNIGSDQQEERAVSISHKPLLDLKDIGDGLMFDPEER